jgi:ribosomal-protein-alanine N-acetyltransferase
VSRLVPLRWWHIEQVMALEEELFGVEAWSQEMFWSELANPDAYYLLAEDDDVSGSDADGRPGGPPLGYAGLAACGPEAYIQTIGVARGAQRHGLGRRMMDLLLGEAIRRGAETCWLEVRTDNAPAQQLYRTLGFVDRGVRRGYYQPTGADALVMACALAAVGRS